FYPITVRYRSLADVPARLQVWWEAPSFAAEVVPAWRFGHTAAHRSPALEADQQAATGRALAGQLGCARCHAGALPAGTDRPPGRAIGGPRARVCRLSLRSGR